MKEFSPMNAAELMDRLAEVYKKSFWSQIAWAAIIYAIMFAAMIVLAFVLAFVLVFALIAANPEIITTGDVPFALIAGIVVLLLPVILLWMAFSSSGHILLSRQAFYGYKTSLSKLGVFRVMVGVITALLAQVLLIIPFMVVAAVGVGVVYFIAFAVGNASVAGVVVFIIYITAAFAGYMIFSNVFALSVAVAVYERRYFFGTIKRSWQLIKPEFWRVLGVRLIWYVVTFAFSATAQGILSLLGMGWELIGGTAGVGYGPTAFVGFIVSFAGPAIISILSAPLSGIMQSLIYFNQRMKTEGLDIEIRIGKLREQV